MSDVLEAMRAEVLKGIIATKRWPVDEDALRKEIERLHPQVLKDLYGRYVESVQTHVL